jgi:alkylglycerol monooxygenase
VGEINPIGIAVPFFFGLMLIEFGYAKWRGLSLYRFNDAIAALTCGMGDQLLGIVLGVVGLSAYHHVFSAYGWLSLDPSAPSTWVFGVVAVDLCYYAFHRYGHRVNLGWAVHVVHHQSEEYNLAVALRQPWFAQIYSWVFYLPLALLGLPTVVWAGSFAINLLYQFWIHTRAIGKLGPIEWVMNTPSHHRVHHGTNPEYIDKNYAGIFIIWDRMFGTFEEEQAEVVYGIMKPMRSWNPVTANLMPLVDLVRASAGETSWVDKLKMWVAPPGWTAAGVSHPPFPAPGRGYDANAVPELDLYILVHLLPVGTATGFVIAYSALWPASWLGLGAAYIFWTGLNWAALHEGVRFALLSERLRLAVVGAAGVAAAAMLTGPLVWVGGTLAGLSLLSAPAVLRPQAATA